MHFGFDSGGASKEDASAAEGLKTAVTANAADDDDRCAHWIPIYMRLRALQYLEIFAHVLSSNRPEWPCCHAKSLLQASLLESSRSSVGGDLALHSSLYCPLQSSYFSPCVIYTLAQP